MKMHKTLLLASVLTTSCATIAEKKETVPGSGVLCMAGLMSISAAVGKHCLSEYNVEGQARLQKNLRRLEDYIAKQPDWGRERVKKFMEEEGGDLYTPEAQCIIIDEDGDSIGMVKGFIDEDAFKATKWVDEMTARPGKPTIGDCL